MEDQRTHNRVLGELYPPISDLPGRVSLIDSGWRVDRTSYSHVTVVSTCLPENADALGNDAFLRPRHCRPKLSDFLPLLRETSGIVTLTPSLPLSLSCETGDFSLRPLDEPGACEIPGDDNIKPQPDEHDRAFYVVGLLGRTAAEAKKLLRNPGSLRQGDWLPPKLVYHLITQENDLWIKRIRMATNLTSVDRHNMSAPIIASGRFERTAGNIFKSFLKPTCNCVLLKGVAGVGKSCLIDKLAHDFMHMQVPSRLQGYLMVGLNIDIFLSSHNSAEEAEKATLRTEMARRRIIWVIDEASRLVDRGSSPAAIDTLLLFIDQGARVILLSDQSFLLEKREAFVRRLNPVYLPPAEGEEVLEIAINLSQHLAKGAGLTVQPDAIKTAVALSSAIPFVQPHAVTALISNAFASCELRGEKEVTKLCVERETQEAVSQGMAIPVIPDNYREFVKLMREEGFLGHDVFLKTFWPKLKCSLGRRFRHERGRGVVWACLLAGGQGIGKAMFLRTVGKMITGTERKVLEVNCVSYQKDHSIQSLLGSPMSYVGYGEGGLLQNFVKQNPDGILIFKKLELGHSNILNLIGEIVDGSFTAGDGQCVSTRNLLVLMTSCFEYSQGSGKIGFSKMPAKDLSQVRNALERLLPPTLLSRLGWTNVFFLDPLNPEALRDFLFLAIQRYEKAMGVRVILSKGVTEKIAARFTGHHLGVNGMMDFYHGSLEQLLDEELERGRCKGGSNISGETLYLFLDKDGEIRVSMQATRPQIEVVDDEK